VSRAMSGGANLGEGAVTAMETIARAAYGYGLPSVDLYRILHDFALDETSAEFKAPLNQISHSRRLADPTDKAIVALNVDTPYSYAWLDLRAEPMVLTMPAVPEDRYQSAQVVDLYTYIVGYVSPRTTGRRGADVLIAGPSWTPTEVPDVRVLTCPTDLCLVLIRTQLFDEDDLDNVIDLQEQVRVRPLSQWQGRARPTTTVPPLRPLQPVEVRATPTVDFLRVLDWMLALMPTLPEDRRLRRDLRLIGVGADLEQALADPARTAEIERGLTAGRQDLLDRIRTVRSSAELFGSREFFDGDNLSRAAGAYLGILGNAAEEYLGVGYLADAEGQPFNGGARYTITFPTGGLPPVDAFWSITLYDAEQHLYANELDRYVLGSRQLPAMLRNVDGSLTIRIQHDRPKEAGLPNWLPCPAGNFLLTFRTYLPLMEIRQGLWTAPPVIPTTERQKP